MIAPRRDRRLALRLAFSLCALVASSCADRVAMAQPVVNRQPEAIGRPDERPPLLFRRVYVPADRGDEWRPAGGYLFVDPDEFERLVELASRQSAELGASPSVRTRC